MCLKLFADLKVGDYVADASKSIGVIEHIKPEELVLDHETVEVTDRIRVNMPIPINFFQAQYHKHGLYTKHYANQDIVVIDDSLGGLTLGYTYDGLQVGFLKLKRKAESNG